MTEEELDKKILKALKKYSVKGFFKDYGYTTLGTLTKEDIVFIMISETFRVYNIKKATDEQIENNVKDFLYDNDFLKQEFHLEIVKKRNLAEIKRYESLVKAILKSAKVKVEFKELDFDHISKAIKNFENNKQVLSAGKLLSKK